MISSCNKEEATPKAKTTINSVTKDLSDIPWEQYQWPAVHRVGGSNGTMNLSYPGLNGADYIVHKCQQDDNFMPKNGHFKDNKIMVYYFTKEEIEEMVPNNFYCKISSGENEIYTPEFHPTSFYNQYVPLIKEIVNSKISEWGDPNIRVESIIFRSEKIRSTPNYWGAPWGNYHGLGGFTFGKWVEN